MGFLLQSPMKYVVSAFNPLNKGSKCCLEPLIWQLVVSLLPPIRKRANCRRQSADHLAGPIIRFIANLLYLRAFRRAIVAIITLYSRLLWNSQSYLTKIFAKRLIKCLIISLFLAPSKNIACFSWNLTSAQADHINVICWRMDKATCHHWLMHGLSLFKEKQLRIIAVVCFNNNGMLVESDTFFSFIFWFQAHSISI